MQIYPEDSILIQEISNGFIVNVKGSYENQEDMCGGSHKKHTSVFPDITSLVLWISDYLEKSNERKESEGSKA